MKIYNNISIPGLGHSDFDYDEVWQSGYTAGYESGYTDGQADCPGPPAKELWLEDLEGNVLRDEVVTLPTTGGDYSFRVVCTDETIEWTWGDMYLGEEGTGTTTVTLTGLKGGGADFFVWLHLRPFTQGATVLPGSEIRFTFEGMAPSIEFACAAGGPYTAITSGYAYYNTYSPTLDFIVASNTAWTVDYVEEFTGVKDITDNPFPAKGMGGHNMIVLRIPAHDGPRRYVFTAYFTDTMEPVKNIIIEQIMEE